MISLRMQTIRLVQPADFVTALDFIDNGVVNPLVGKDGHAIEGHLIAHVLDVLGGLVGGRAGRAGKVRIETNLPAYW